MCDSILPPSVNSGCGSQRHEPDDKLITISHDSRGMPLALYIHIIKVHEEDVFAEFEYGETDAAMGRFRFNKQTGDVVLLRPAPGDSQRHRYHRAVVKVVKAWHGGNLPNETSWAS